MDITVSVQVDVGAPPGAVYTTLTDPTVMHLWAAGVQSAHWQEGSSLQPGGQFNLKYRYARRVSDITMEITAAEPNSQFEYHTVKGPYPIEVKFTLTPIASGTFVTYSQNALADTKMTSLMFLLTGWFAKRMTRKRLKRDVERLKTVAMSDKSTAFSVGAPE